MRVARAVSCSIALLSFSVPALSADKSFELTEVAGKVLVTTKEGISPAAIGQKLPEGTRIFVGNDSTTRMTSADGVCDISLPSERVTIINHKKLCDVQVIPTASNLQPNGLPPSAIGLTFFGGVSSVVLYSIIRNDNDEPVSIR